MATAVFPAFISDPSSMDVVVEGRRATAGAAEDHALALMERGAGLNLRAWPGAGPAGEPAERAPRRLAPRHPGPARHRQEPRPLGRPACRGRSAPRGSEGSVRVGLATSCAAVT